MTVELKWGDESVATGLVRGAGGAGAITILAGQITGSLAISAPEDDGDQVYHPPQTENLSASYVGVEIGSARLTRRDNDAKPVATIAVALPVADEGTVPTTVEAEQSGIVLEVTLDRAFGVDAVIPFAVTGDTGALSGPSETSFRISASKTSWRKAIVLAPDNQDKDGERSVTFTLETSQDFDHYTLGAPASATVRILDDDTPPGPPQNLTARPGASGQLRLTWEDPEDGGGGQPVVKYQIRGTQPVDTGWGDVPDSGEGGANRNSRTLLNLTNGVAHTVEIRAVNGADLEGPAAAVTATPLDAITVSFVHAEQSADEDGEVTVEVRLSSPPVGGTPVEVPIVARRGADLGSDEYEGVPESVTFAANETSKSFTVNFIGDDDDERDEMLTLEIGELPDGYVAVPPSETVLTLEDDDLPIVTASFGHASATVIDEGDGIDVVVRLDEEPDREVVLPIVATRSSGLETDEYTGVPESVTFGPRTTEVRFTVQFVDDTVIEPDATLTLGFEATLPFRVLAGTPAAMAIALKNDDGAPAAPEGLTASSGHESVRLDWLAVANDTPVTRYEVQWQRAAGGSVSDWQDVGLETTWRVDGLTNDREYIFRVRAVNAHGEGWWATVRGTPKERIFAIPDAPQNLGLTNEDSSRATLRWTPPKNAFDPERSASRLQGYRIEACRASCGDEARWHALVENTRSIATEWVHGVLAPGVIRENRYRVRAINLNGKHGDWSNVASLGPTVVDPDLLKVRALDPETLEMRFTVERNPDGKKFHLRYRVNGSGDDAWTARVFPLTRKGEYEWEPTGLEPSPFDGAPTLYQVEFDFSPDFDSAWKRTRWKQMPLEGTGSTVTPPQPGRDEPVRVEIDVNGDGRPDGNVHLSLAMGQTKRYRLRLAPGRSCVDGQYQVRATVVGYSGVGTRGGHPALVHYANGRDWAVLECDGPFRPWTTVEVHAPSFAEHRVAAHERADLLLNGEWPIAWRHELYRDTQAAQSPEQGLRPTSRLAQWQAAVDATVTLPRALAAPAGVTVREVPGRTDALRVDWQDVPGAVGYELQWRFGADPYETDPRPDYQYNRVRRPASADRPVTLEFDGAVTRSFTVRVRAWGAADASRWSAGAVRPGSTPMLSVHDTQAFEENGKAGFAVTLSEVSADKVTVRYATATDTSRAAGDRARAGDDYTRTDGTLTFEPYETEQTVWVVLADDDDEDSGETFLLRLSNATGAGIADGEAVGTILNREGNTAPTGVPTVTGTARVGEALTASVDGIEDADGLDDAEFAFQWLSDDGTGESDIDGARAATYEVAPSDVGRTLKVRVTFTDDGGSEETVVSAATAPVAAALPAVSVRAVTGHVAEGAAAVFTLSRTGDAAQALAVAVAVTAEGVALDGTAPTEATFAAGARTVEVSLATVDDAAHGADGTVTLRVGSGTGYEAAASAQASVTVLEDDAAPAAGETVLWSATMTVSDTLGGSVGGNQASAFTDVSAPGGFRVRSMSYRASSATLRIRMTGTLPGAEGLALHAGDRTLTGPRMNVVSKHFGALVTFTVNDLDWAIGRKVAVRFVQSSADAASRDAALASLAVGDAALAPAFDADTLVYAADADADTQSVTVTAAARQNSATVELDPADADGGTPGHQVALGAGETLVTARVTAADGETVRAYRVVVTRAETEAETGPVAATLAVGGATAEAGRFQVRAAFAEAVTGFALDDLSALQVGGEAADASDLVEAETGRAWTAWVAAAEAGRYVVRLGAGAAKSGERESAAAVLVADVDAQGNATAVAGPAVTAVSVAAPDGGASSWGRGDDVEVTLRFTEAVTVDTTGGTPTVGLTVGGNARTAAYASGSGTAALAFAYRVVADDGAVNAVAVTASSLALNGGTIRDGAERSADRAHPGAERTLETPEVKPTLTAAFSGLPSAHDGESAFSLSLAFSEEVALSATVLAGESGEPGALTIAGGTLERLIQVEPGSNRQWTIRVTPAGDDPVTVTLAATADCAADGAICTADDRALASAVSATVAGPSSGPAATGALTATFQGMPATHGGPDTTFDFQVLFSESVKVSYRVLQGPDAFDVSGGNVTKSGRVDGRDELRSVAVEPSGWDDVTVTLEPTANCDDDGAICTADGRMLSNRQSATVRGPIAIDVADATVTEGPGVTLDFVVTLSRAASGDGDGGLRHRRRHGDGGRRLHGDERQAHLCGGGDGADHRGPGARRRGGRRRGDDEAPALERRGRAHSRRRGGGHDRELRRHPEGVAGALRAHGGRPRGGRGGVALRGSGRGRQPRDAGRPAHRARRQRRADRRRARRPGGRWPGGRRARVSRRLPRGWRACRTMARSAGAGGRCGTRTRRTAAPGR